MAAMPRSVRAYAQNGCKPMINSRLLICI